MIDVHAVIKTLLEAQGAVTAQVGARIYAVELPGDIVSGWQRVEDVDTSILIEVLPDSEHAETCPRVEANVALHCFGPTPKDAADLAGVVYEALDSVKDRSKKRQMVGNFLILEMRQTAQPIQEQIPESLWNFTRTSYRAHIAENP